MFKHVAQVKEKPKQAVTPGLQAKSVEQSPASENMQDLADNSKQVQQSSAYQLMANNHASVQLRRGNKKSSWNQNQVDQNKRLFERRAERQARYHEAWEREQNAVMDNMKPAQKLSYESQDGPVRLGIRTLYNKGFSQQNSAPRVVFNKAGDFDQCKTHATEVFGALGNNLSTIGDLNASGVQKERYSIQFNGITVIVRNFSSNNAILGTIELQTGNIFEFKYA
jgi:hypothetical protein